MNIYDEPLKVPFNLLFANDPITILSEKEYIGLVSLKIILLLSHILKVRN